MIREIIGLFVDDEFLAAAILIAVAVAAAIAFSGVAEPWFAGVFLTVALPAALILGVVRTVRRARP